MRLTVSFFGLALLATGCVQESLDPTGQWSGSMIVDGEHKNVPLRLELVHLEQAIEGSILWDDYRGEIKAGSAEGPELRFESVQSAALRRPLRRLFGRFSGRAKEPTLPQIQQRGHPRRRTYESRTHYPKSAGKANY